MTISKRLEEARQAYERKDKQGSALAHSPERIQMAPEEHSPASSQYIGSMIYGGLDGIITTFAVVSGVVGAQLDAGIILILGAANLLGDGFSMATGAFLSSKSEQEYYDRERERKPGRWRSSRKGRSWSCTRSTAARDIQKRRCGNGGDQDPRQGALEWTR